MRADPRRPRLWLSDQQDRTICGYAHRAGTVRNPSVCSFATLAVQRKLAVEGLPSTVTPDAAVYSDFENAAVPPRTGTLLGMAPVEDRPKDLFAA